MYKLLLLLCLSYQYKAITLIHEEHKLNSSGRPHGITRACIKLSIPARVEYLVYSLMASPANPLSDLGLHTQLRDHIKKDGVNLGIGTTLLNDLFVPQGDGVCDVQIMPDSTAAAKYIAKEPISGLADYSRTNISNCIIGIPIKYSEKPQALYLCLRNPSAFNAEFITIEVEALQRQ